MEFGGIIDKFNTGEDCNHSRKKWLHKSPNRVISGRSCQPQQLGLKEGCLCEDLHVTVQPLVFLPAGLPLQGHGPISTAHWWWGECNRLQKVGIVTFCLVGEFAHESSQYNDLFGHAEGDEALRQLAQCLVNGRRSSDVVVRTGGEEFVLVLQETDREGTMNVAEQLRSSVAAISNLKRPITISLGVAMLNEHIHKPEVLLECADRALYEAKKAGRNRICIYTEEMKS